jgi:hypothetical protein
MSLGTNTTARPIVNSGVIGLAGRERQVRKGDGKLEKTMTIEEVEVQSVALRLGLHRVADLMRERLTGEWARFADLFEDCRIKKEKSGRITTTVPGSVHATLYDDQAFRINNPIGLRQGVDGPLEFLVHFGSRAISLLRVT